MADDRYGKRTDHDKEIMDIERSNRNIREEKITNSLSSGVDIKLD